jgi:hypothetical protein
MQRTRRIDRNTEGIDHAPLPALIGKDTQGIGAIDSLAEAGKGHGVEGLDRRSLLVDTHDFRELGKAARREGDAFTEFQKAG